MYYILYTIYTINKFIQQSVNIVYSIYSTDIEYILLIACCYCWYWPPVHEVCPNYEVVEVQPLTLTTPDIGSIAFYYIAFALDLLHPLLLPSDIYLPSRRLLTCLHTGSSAYLGVTCLYPSIPENHHPLFRHLSLSETNSSSPPSPSPRLPDSRRCHSHL